MIFSAVLPGNLLGAPVKRRQEIRRILKVKRRLFDIDESPKKKLKIKDEEINFENEVSFVILILDVLEQKNVKRLYLSIRFVHLQSGSREMESQMENEFT